MDADRRAKSRVLRVSAGYGFHGRSDVYGQSEIERDAVYRDNGFAAEISGEGFRRAAEGVGSGVCAAPRFSANRDEYAKEECADD